MKYLGQIFAAIVYTCIYTGIMYLIITLSVGLVIALPWWGILLFILIGGGILEGIIQFLGTMGLAPYLWITDNNMLAAWISILLALYNIGMNIYRLWVAIAGHGKWHIIFGIVASVLLLQFLYTAVVGIMVTKNHSED